ncbi:MAG: hypothetical protein HW380_2680 [Magnetococcales bacterium]|nr:hypothetical protein [Magnetococcales bacterium]
MPTYPLMFDSSGRTYTTFTVPSGKVVYLVRAPQVSNGTAMVSDLASLRNYQLDDGCTVCLTPFSQGQTVSLAFMARSNPNIYSVNAEVTYPRGGMGCDRV